MQDASFEYEFISESLYQMLLMAGHINLKLFESVTGLGFF